MLQALTEQLHQLKISLSRWKIDWEYVNKSAMSLENNTERQSRNTVVAGCWCDSRATGIREDEITSGATYSTGPKFDWYCEESDFLFILIPEESNESQYSIFSNMSLILTVALIACVAPFESPKATIA